MCPNVCASTLHTARQYLCKLTQVYAGRAGEGEISGIGKTAFSEALEKAFLVLPMEC